MLHILSPQPHPFWFVQFAQTTIYPVREWTSLARRTATDPLKLLARRSTAERRAAVSNALTTSLKTTQRFARALGRRATAEVSILRRTRGIFRVRFARTRTVRPAQTYCYRSDRFCDTASSVRPAPCACCCSRPISTSDWLPSSL